MSILLTGSAFLFKDSLLSAFGATKTIFPYAQTYLSIYITGTVFAVLSLGLNQFIICQGFAGIGVIPLSFFRKGVYIVPLVSAGVFAVMLPRILRERENEVKIHFNRNI